MKDKDKDSINLWSEIKRINKVKLIDLVLPNYKVNRIVFRFALFILIISGVYIMYLEDFNFNTKYYFYCDEINAGGCANPFYVRGVFD